MTAPTCGLGGCSAAAVCRVRLLPRNARSLFDGAPYWVKVCSGHIKNAMQMGQVLVAESIGDGEPERIVWRDEEPKKEGG